MVNNTTQTMRNGQENSAEKFVKHLLNDGALVNCDETNKNFQNNQQSLPEFYDQHLYKRGQQFFYKHVFALFFSKFLGLLTVLSIPSSLQILILTGMSNTNMSAYKRYMSTIFHMCIWYEDDLKPGSRLWESINYVKKRHNAASKKNQAINSYRISQKDMALTQFGFMGFALARSELIGIHNASEEEFKAFIHVWRTIGHLMGVEERFNICRESVQETREICNLLIEHVFRPSLDEKHPDFLTMASYLINGLWSMNPFLKFDAFLSYLYLTIENSTDTNRPTYINLDMRGKIHLNVVLFVIASLKYNFLRIFHNIIQLSALWLMKVCPFLAYYQFGKNNSHVNVLDNYKRLEY